MSSNRSEAVASVPSQAWLCFMQSSCSWYCSCSTIAVDSQRQRRALGSSMLTEALHPFSWKYAELVQVWAELLEVLQPNRALPAYSLLQLAPAHVDLYDALPACLLDGVRHLFSIRCWSEDADLAALLQHPTAQQLQQLRFCYTPVPDTFPLICALPQLVCCSIYFDVAGGQNRYTAGGAAVPWAPHRDRIAWQQERARKRSATATGVRPLLETPARQLAQSR